MRIVKALVKLASITRSEREKTLSLFLSGLVFAVALPWLFSALANKLKEKVKWRPPHWVDLALGTPAVITGVFLSAWSVITQWRVGGGSPLPTAPTEELVTEGPYRHTRNPMQLGSMLTHFGLGTVRHSLIPGVVSLIGTALPWTLYHRYIEEPELAERFGHGYELYRKRTAFLIPGVW
ncbi:MAG: methyltransferase family protein [Armatimonadota bacterium]